MAESNKQQEQAPQQPEVQVPEKKSNLIDPGRGPPIDDSLQAKAVHFADRVSSHIKRYPYKVSKDPTFPPGVVEGSLVGIAAVLALQPIRSQAMRMLAKSPQWKILGRSVLMAGQLVIGVQVTLYAGALYGSYSWLSTLKDFAAAPTDSTTFVHVHKSIMADALCQDPLLKAIKQQLATQADSRAADIAAAINANNPPSFLDWIQGPEKVVTDELIRTVAACYRRNKTSGAAYPPIKEKSDSDHDDPPKPGHLF
jgi:hypothetical protein